VHRPQRGVLQLRSHVVKHIPRRRGFRGSSPGQTPCMTTLTAEQVTAELAATPGWEVADGQITKTVTRKDFRDALLYLNAVGYLAEQANHHPDIFISWNKVTLTLVSHSAGGLTAKDFALARQVNDLD